MSQLKPSGIVLHCRLHKTGSTYIQRNLSRNQDLFLQQEVLYLGQSTFLWNLPKQSLPDQAALLKQQLGASTEGDKLTKTPNPGLNEKGLELAVQARTLFSQTSWKLFRKFHEKKFSKSS